MLHAVVCNFCGVDSSNYKIQRLWIVAWGIINYLRYYSLIVLLSGREVVARESTAVCACRKLPMPRGLRHGAERKKSGGFLLGRLRGFHARLTCTVYRAFDTVHFPGTVATSIPQKSQVPTLVIGGNETSLVLTFSLVSLPRRPPNTSLVTEKWSRYHQRGLFSLQWRLVLSNETPVSRLVFPVEPLVSLSKGEPITGLVFSKWSRYHQ